MIKKCKNIILGTSEAVDGNMLLGNALSSENRQKYFDKINLGGLPVASAGLANSNIVKAVNDQKNSSIVNKVDALITNRKNLILTITTADCLPIYFYEPLIGIIGIAHAGWQGLLSGVIGNTVDTMKEKYQADVSKIRMVIGPHIQKCHFEVKDDVFSQFKKYQSARIEINEKKYINLSAVVVSQIKELGILKSNLFISQKCTHRLRGRYFSFRRDKVLKTMINFIVCKK